MQILQTAPLIEYQLVYSISSSSRELNDSAKLTGTTNVLHGYVTVFNTWQPLSISNMVLLLHFKQLNAGRFPTTTLVVFFCDEVLIGGGDPWAHGLILPSFYLYGFAQHLPHGVIKINTSDYETSISNTSIDLYWCGMLCVACVLNLCVDELCTIN